MKVEEYEQMITDVLVFFSKENFQESKEKYLKAFIEMVVHLVMTEDLAFDRENERIYWTATGETLGGLSEI